MVIDFQKLKKVRYKERTKYEKEKGKTLRQEEKTLKQQEKLEKEKKKPSKKKGIFSGKFLKKPSVTLIHSLNAEKAIMQGANNLALVREVERKEYNPDNRSLFFNDSFVKEKEKDRKWLLE